eukprot:GEMP01024752.1.p1 GENE.GEMP01024752.1~~GEMP01024752.1.p1  ORF type:complete len:471 (+),score=94.91 GEMP01024752.1:120-1532(+)
MMRIKDMPAEHLARLNYAIIFTAFTAIWYLVMAVHRAPLPTLNNVAAPKTWACTVLASASDDAQEYLSALERDIKATFKVSVQVQEKPFCTNCEDWLQKTQPDASLSCTYRLHVSKGATGLSLNDEMDGWLRLSDQKSVSTGIALLGKTWFQQLHDDRIVATAPLYLFSFYYVSDGLHRVSWDFQSDVESPLSSVLGRINVAFDFDLESQVVNTARLTNKARSESVVLSKIQSHFLQDANMWGTDITTDSMYRPPPIIKFAAFSPSRPLTVVDEAKNPISSFFIQGWGAVAVMQHNSTNLSSALCGWVGHMRSRLLHLPADPFGYDPLVKISTVSGLSKWELQASLRVIFPQFQQKSLDTLMGVYSLATELTGIEVPERVSMRFALAKELYEKAQLAAKEGNIEEAMAAAKRSLLLAFESQHDDAMVAKTHFSWEYTAAIYLPILLPTGLPFVHLIAGIINKRRAEAAAR